MSRFAALLLAASMLAPLPAAATVEPVPSPKDGRVRTLAYDPQQVYRLTSTGRVPLVLIFDAGERPGTIAGPRVTTDAKGAEDWVAIPTGKKDEPGNVLILQPLRAVEPSMLFVRAVSADGQGRQYMIELRTRDGNMVDGNDPAAYASVQFTYKSQPSPEAAAEWRARRDAAQAARAERATAAKLAHAAYATRRNYAYEKRGEGCPVLAPVFTWDDGHHTTLVFAPHATMPEVYTINQDGKKAVVTTIPEALPSGLQVTVPSIQRELRLQRGGKACALRNDAFDPYGTQPGGGSGTVSPDVVRQVRAP